MTELPRSTSRRDLAGRPRYIFVLTTGHSGGTLINLLLGASPAVFAAGESLRIWNLRTLATQSKSTQEFWSNAVRLLAADGWPPRDLDQKTAIAAPIDLWRSWTRIVADLSPASVVADKTLSLNLIRKICEADLVEPFFVHLVRDPRAVYYSFFKKYSRSLRQARSWNKSHEEIESFLGRRTDFIRIRYEDLSANLMPCIQHVLDAAGQHFGIDLLSGIPSDLAARPLDDPLFENVIFAGNRMRLEENRKGRIIAPDNNFVDELPTLDWALVNVFCLRRARRYGYRTCRAQLLAETADRHRKNEFC